MRALRIETPEGRLAYAVEAARRAQELFPYVGITVRWNGDDPGFYLEVSEFDSLDAKLLNGLFMEYFNELGSLGDPFELSFLPPGRPMVMIAPVVAYLPPLALAQAA